MHESLMQVGGGIIEKKIGDIFFQGIDYFCGKLEIKYYWI